MFKIKLFIAKILPKNTLSATKSIYRKLRGRFFEFRYRGREVYCPCCNKNFSKFLPFKYEKGLNNTTRFKDTYKNTTCPYCYSMPRHRIVCHYLAQVKPTLSKNTGTVLMIGAEYAIELWLKTNNIPYTTADLSDKTANIKLDIQNMPFNDQTWSFIICNHVLEHVLDFNKSLNELNRVLRSDGFLEISSPTDRTLPTMVEDTTKLTTFERIKRFGQFDHMRIFGRDFAEQLANKGFQVKEIKGTDLSQKIGAIVGPANYDDNTIYICSK